MKSVASGLLPDAALWERPPTNSPGLRGIDGKLPIAECAVHTWDGPFWERAIRLSG